MASIYCPEVVANATAGKKDEAIHTFS
jgi:hypothetical protein